MTSRDGAGRRGWDGKTQALVDRLDALLAARRARGAAPATRVAGPAPAPRPGADGRVSGAPAAGASSSSQVPDDGGDAPRVAAARRFFR